MKGALQLVAALAIGGMAAIVAPPDPPEAAWFEGRSVSFAAAESDPGTRPFAFGPWKLGGRLRDDRPHDRRLNLYLVCRGAQYRNARWPEFDHNVVISAVPEKDVAEWDVYWAVVLDPALRDDLRAEQDMLVAAQANFRPGDLFEFEDVPGRAALRSLRIDSLGELERFRRERRKLPRLIILPAGFAVRAVVEESAPDSAAAPR